MFRLALLFLLLWMTCCTRSPIKSPEQAMRPLKDWPELSDDLDFSTMAQALKADIQVLRSKGDAVLSFGPQKISAREYAAALELLASEARADATGERFRKMLRDGFQAFEVYGQDHWGEIFLTAYYEPVIDGALRPNAVFTAALFGRPKDLVEVDLGSFAAARPQLSVLPENKVEQRSLLNVLRGRLLPGRDATTPPRVVAFPDRAGIVNGALKSDVGALAYVDPIDAFFLQIQGSGVVRLREGGEIKVGYAAQNGYPYVPIGKFLLDKIPKDKMSQQAIEAHLRALPTEQMQALLNRNPSYVFFQRLKTAAGQSYLGTDVVAGRTIATDATYFPKGALGFLQFEKPQFAAADAAEPTGFQKTSRFVMDQDTGGAIRGAGRVDLFWGRGPEAKQAAGVMRGKGRLVYFLPRAEWLSQATHSEAQQ